MRRKIAAGNWKMNGRRAQLAELRALAVAYPEPACDVLICPPATLLASATEALSVLPVGKDTWTPPGVVVAK